MKARTVGLALAFGSLFFASRADAQTGCQVTPQYSNYATRSIDSNLNITQTVTTDGYGIMNREFCLQANTAYHTPHGVNKITEPNGTVHGGAFSGSPVCAVNCYVFAQNTITFQGTPGAVNTDEVDGSVSCSIAGTFWTVFSTFSLRLAHTNETYQSEEPDPSDPNYKFCLYYMSCPNGNDKATCPANKTILGPVPITFHCPPKYHCWYLVVNGQCENETICIPGVDDLNCS